MNVNGGLESMWKESFVICINFTDSVSWLVLSPAHHS
jgi:hypothetical protein